MEACGAAPRSPYCKVYLIGRLLGEIALDTSIRIRTHFEANSREQWELGHQLFQQDLQGARFWNQVGVAIRKQAKRMGVPARQLKYHDIVVKLEHIAADLQSIRTDFADDQSASKIPSFVLFMRKYRPSEDPTWDIWKYVLDRRIVPALVRGSAEQMVAKSMSLDADVHPPPVIAPNPTDDSDATCEAIQESILSKLNPRDRAIFLMTYWSLQTARVIGRSF